MIPVWRPEGVRAGGEVQYALDAAIALAKRHQRFTAIVVRRIWHSIERQ